MNIENYECNRCGITFMCSGCPQCSKCGNLMTRCPTVDEIMLQMRYRRIHITEPLPADDVEKYTKLLDEEVK